MQTAADRIETANLILRPMNGDDLKDLIAFQSDAETMRFLGGAKGPEESWRALAMLAGSWTVAGYGFFSMIERASGRWVGRTGPWQPLGWPGPEVGWGVLPEFAGRGYAHEAAKACIDYVFDHLGWDEVIHTIHPDNARSIRLAERLGSRHRGPGALPPPNDHMTVDIWGQTREEWRARSSLKGAGLSIGF